MGGVAFGCSDELSDEQRATVTSIVAEATQILDDAATQVSGAEPCSEQAADVAVDAVVRGLLLAPPGELGDETRLREEIRRIFGDLCERVQDGDDPAEATLDYCDEIAEVLDEDYAFGSGNDVDDFAEGFSRGCREAADQ
jgi:hypothetical protein